jgi:hypothetical protein
MDVYETPNLESRFRSDQQIQPEDLETGQAVEKVKRPMEKVAGALETEAKN